MDIMKDAMMKALVGTMGNRFGDINPNYCYHLEWLFEEDFSPVPHQEDFPTVVKAMDAMVTIWNTPKTLVHISLSRRNA